MGASVRKNITWRSWSRSSYANEQSGPARSERASLPDLGPRFRLHEALGRGGMGEVYRAADLELGFDVALKLLHSVTVADRLRLKSEFRALANVAHPNLVDLHELFIDEKSAFFTMELVSGAEFISHVTGGLGRVVSSDSRARLEDSGRQLALALHALHVGGKLHRDVKPSNVMVTHAGRVVLLDFGLSAAFGTNERDADGPILAGTIFYMAPEQAWGATLSPAADWYAFGATLFEAITGNVPIEGNPAEVVQKKRSYRPASLLDQGFDLSPELDQLLQELLDPNPTLRPGAERILQALGGELLGARLSVPAVVSAKTPSLVGRQSELEQLESALSASRDGITQLIHVVGPSGIGKSSLLRTLTMRVPSEARILSSRCHPQEAVAFNAIDGLIDDLIQRFADDAALASLRLDLEARAALVRIFPSLGPTFERVAPCVALAETSMQRLRQLAFQGLCQLFAFFQPDAPLLMWIDDVQWADADSGAFLQALLNVKAPKGIVLVLAYRDTDWETSPCLRALRVAKEEQPQQQHREATLELRPLVAAESWQLIEQIAGPSSSADLRGQLDRLIEQAAGVPFFVCELARHLSSHSDSSDAAALGLDSLLSLRMAGLPSECQLVLDVMSVAGAPLAQDVVLRAAGLSDANRGLLTNLERLSVLRTTDSARRTSEVYHHRIREQVLSAMPAPKRAAYHRSIALALLSTANPNLLTAVDHFEAAGDVASVRRYVVHTAERAAQVLAFDRAAQLYQRAIELDARDVAPHELHHRLAVALASAGRGKEAGEAFLVAGDRLRDSAAEDPQLLLALRQSAAEQFIQTGHHQQGVHAMTTVLGELGILFPENRGEAIRKATLLRLSSFFRSSKSRAVGQEYDEQALRRFDALWAMGHRLSMVDHTFTTYASIRCALDAVQIGEPIRLLRAFATESANLSTVPARPFQKRADQLMARARELSDAQVDPYDKAYVRGALGVVEAFRGQFRDSLTSMDWAIQAIKASNRASHFERALWQVYAVTALSYLGELKELGQRVSAALDEARQRDDRFAARNASFGRATLGWLAQDRVAHAVEQADLALSWAPKEYTTQHYQHFVSSIHSHLYARDGIAAWERSEREWPLLKRNYFLSLAFVRDELLELRARAALGAAAELKRDGRSVTSTGDNIARLRKVALACAEEIAKHDLTGCRPWAGFLRGLVAAESGNVEEARRLLERAIGEFDACEMSLYRETARASLGALTAGDAGAAQLAEAGAWLRRQEVVAPTKLLEMLAPGVDFSRLHRTS